MTAASPARTSGYRVTFLKLSLPGQRSKCWIFLTQRLLHYCSTRIVHEVCVAHICLLHVAISSLVSVDRGEVRRFRQGPGAASNDRMERQVSNDRIVSWRQSVLQLVRMHGSNKQVSLPWTVVLLRVVQRERLNKPVDSEVLFSED